MVAKKRSSSARTKPKASASTLHNLAARPTSPDDPEDDQLVDHSGVFRVTSRLAQAQTARDEDTSLRFASDSLVMAAQRDNFRDDGPTLDDAVDENAIVDDAATAVKRQRLTALAAQIQARRRARR